MKRTLTIVVVEAVVIIGLLAPALALAKVDPGDLEPAPQTDTAQLIADLQAQIEVLDARLDLVGKNVVHVHADAHDALGTEIDNVNHLRVKEGSAPSEAGPGHVLAGPGHVLEY
jgi:hypothetical protein